jgi:hypothetical protein
LGDRDRDRVSTRFVPGAVGARIVHPSGKPWSLSVSVGVRRRTDDVVGVVALSGTPRVSPQRGDPADIVTAGSHVGSDGPADEAVCGVAVGALSASLDQSRGNEVSDLGAVVIGSTPLGVEGVDDEAVFG